MTQPSNRFLAPDLARGFMLLLIVMAHAPFYLYLAEQNPFTRPFGDSSLDHTINFFSTLLIDGRAYPMFSVLFGFGLAYMVKRRLDKGFSTKEVKRIVRRRSLYLILFGFIHSVFIGGLDIISFYGLAGLLIGWLLFKPQKMKRRAILILTVLYLVLLPLVWLGLGFAGEMEESAAWVDPNATYIESVIFKMISFPIMVLIQLVTYPTLLAVVIGTWVADKNWIQQPEHFLEPLKRIAIWGILLGVVGGLPFAFYLARIWEPSLGTLIFTKNLHIFTGLAGGLGYTALFAYLSSIIVKTVPKIVQPISAVGRRSLTFYLYQEAILVLILAPVALGLGGSMSSTGAFAVALIIWISAVGLASLLEAKDTPGPADHWIRQLTYKNKKQTSSR